MSYYATVDEISRMMRWSIAYTRKLASVEKWRTKGTRPQQYDLRDVAQHGLRRSEK